ncbi:MAG: glycoside hydrolase family 2 protein, partial [Flavisolibacter sp.]
MKLSTRLFGPPIIFFTFIFLYSGILHAQSAMINVYGRKTTSLNGKWNGIIDPTGVGEWRKVWEEKKPQKKTDFVEYSFDGGPTLHVPGDFNTQMPELFYVEGTIWYKKTFVHKKQSLKRLFIHFGAVNYLTDVYLNGKLIGKHEGGFTPFQFELTEQALDGENVIVVKVNNQRQKEGLPGLGYDWFNYGGITRDVHLVETNETYIEDYLVQLKKNSFTEIQGWVKLNGLLNQKEICIRIPELEIDYRVKTNNQGLATIKFSSDFQLWSPEKPKLYKVIIESERDTVIDNIGFRSIEVKGSKIFLNGKNIFIKGVNIHEERPMQSARAFSKEDARTLLTWAKETGCNLVRLSHYPHNENMVKMAEEMGLMVWDELPVYQHIEFSSPDMPAKLNLMMKEMIRRDRNRCGVVIWSLSNE